MRVLIAPNSFKHCLDAREVGAAIRRGVRSACPEAVTDIIPLSDGGDGLIAALADQPRALRMEAETTDPLGRPIRASWLKMGPWAVIESAAASGLARLKDSGEYAPLTASTAGTGILVRAALENGCRRIAVGLGGSATVDAGCGLAAALGFGLLDDQTREIPKGGGGLARLARIDVSGKDPRLVRATVTALADVENSLADAATVYAPQKGASPAEVRLLSRNLEHWARVVKRDLGVDVACIPGGGAAGGMGAGCIAFLGAQLVPGAQWVAEQLGLRPAMRRADLVLTGEGRIDNQTVFGKVPAFVGRMARSLGKPVMALGGTVAAGADLTAVGITRCIAISPPGLPLTAAIKNAAKYLEMAAAELMLVFRR